MYLFVFTQEELWSYNALVLLVSFKRTNHDKKLVAFPGCVLCPWDRRKVPHWHWADKSRVVLGTLRRKIRRTPSCPKISKTLTAKMQPLPTQLLLCGFISAQFVNIDLSILSLAFWCNNIRFSWIFWFSSRLNLFTPILRVSVLWISDQQIRPQLYLAIFIGMSLSLWFHVSSAVAALWSFDIFRRPQVWCQAVKKPTCTTCWWMMLVLAPVSQQCCFRGEKARTAK